MKILRPGVKPEDRIYVLRGKCRNCGCSFELNKAESVWRWWKFWFSVDCPFCCKRVSNQYLWWWEI